VNRSPQASLSRSALAVLAGGVFAAAAALATRLLLARAVDPAAFGRLTLAIALATASGGLAGLGLNSAAARRIAQLGDTPRQAAASARTAVFAAAIAGAAGAVLLAGAGALAARSARWAGLGPLLLAVAPIVLSLAVGNACLGVARGRGDSAGRALVRDGLGGLWRLLGVALAIAWVAPRREAALGWGFMLGSLAAEATFFVYVERHGWLARLPGQARDRPLLRSLPDFAGLAALAQAAQWFDVVLLGALAPAAVVGLYGVARGIEKTLELANEAAAHRFLPAAAASAAQPQALQSLYRAARRVALALVWPGAALGLFAPRALLAVLFGAQYVAAAPALRWLAAGLVLSAACGYNDKAAIALGGEVTARRILALALLAGIAAGLALMPAYGASGAALAWGTMLVAQNVLLSVWLWRRRRLAPWGRELAAFLGWALLPTTAAALALDRLAPNPGLALLGVGLVAGIGGLCLLARRAPEAG